MPQKACVDTSRISDTTTASDILTKIGITKKCGGDSKCGVCFKLSEGNADQMKKQAILTLGPDGKSIDVQLKNAKKLPRDFSSILAKLASQFDAVIENSEISKPTRH